MISFEAKSTSCGQRLLSVLCCWEDPSVPESTPLRIKLLNLSLSLFMFCWNAIGIHWARCTLMVEEAKMFSTGSRRLHWFRWWFVRRRGKVRRFLDRLVLGSLISFYIDYIDIIITTIRRFYRPPIPPRWPLLAQVKWCACVLSTRWASTSVLVIDNYVLATQW